MPPFDVVISEVYAGGGDAGATFKYDFIELYNAGSSPVDLFNWRVLVGSEVTPLAGIILPGKYYLIMEAGGGGGTLDLPPPDAIGPDNLNAASGTVTLQKNSGIIFFVDDVVYGGLSSTTSYNRIPVDVDTDVYSNDFTARIPTPRDVGTGQPQAPYLWISDVAQSESDTSFMFTVSLDVPAGPGGVTFDIAAAENGSATAGSAPPADYAYLPENALIPEGSTKYQFQVWAIDDTTIEPDETFLVNVTNVSGATVLDGQATGTILNDDTPPTLSSSTPSDNAAGVGIGANIVLNFDGPVQAGSGNITLHPATGPDIVIPVGGGATGTVTFNGNQVAINPAADLLSNVHYDVLLGSGAITKPTGEAFGGLTAGALDFTTAPPPSLSITADQAVQAEGNAGLKQFTFTVTRSSDLSGTSDVDYALTGSGGHPADANDFTGVALPSGSIHFAAGVATQPLIINVNGDTTIEPDEGFTVTLSNPTNATIGTGTASGTILDDDTPPTLSSSGSVMGYTFSAQTTYPVGAIPVSGWVADLNRDGKEDLVVANAVDKTVSVLLGNGDGTFQQKVDYATGSSPFSVTVADLNRDGKDDLVVANLGSNTVSVLLGNGDGTFAPQATYATGKSPESVTIADLNRDGKNDLVVANLHSNTVSVLLGNGDGTFQTQVPYATGLFPGSVTVADLNRDGNDDLVVANQGSNTVSVLRGNGDGTFAPQATAATGMAPESVTVADLNGDGKNDLVVANLHSNTVSVLLGNGDGTFQPQVPYATGTAPESVAVVDLNGDGKDDLVVANYGNNNVSVLFGNGDGTFAPQVTYAAGSNPVSVTAIDLNRDSQDDLVVTNSGSGTVSVLLGSPSFAVTSITATSPAPPGAPLKIGDTLTFTLATDLPIDSVAGGTPTLTLSNGATATYTGFDSAGLHFSYTVQAGQTPAEDTGDLQVTALSLNGASVDHTATSGFATQVLYAVGNNPDSVAVADLNRDGIDDLVAANNGSKTVSVLLGNGDGTFQTQVPYAAGLSPESVTVADLNRDGKDDLVVANLGSNTVSVLPGNGDGTFAPQATYATGTAPDSVTVADLNGDGKGDLVVANQGSNNVSLLSVLLGNGDGTFQTQAPYWTGTSPESVTVADLNRDGIDDLVAANQGSNFVSVLLGNGNGNFKLQVPYATGLSPESVTVADLNRDGIDDLVVANQGSNTVSVLLGNGNGTFQTQVPYATGKLPESVTVADVNRDGVDDLVVANRGSGGVSGSVAVLLGNGDGTFQTAVPYAAGSNPFSVTAADVNRDGRDDLVVANNGSTTVSVLLNTSTPAASLDASSFAGATGKDTALVLDATAPATPPGPVLANDTGTPGDKLTSDPSITYPTPAAGNELLYKLDNGSFSTTVPTIATNGSADGQHTVTIEEQDTAGNIGGTSSLTFTLDKNDAPVAQNGSASGNEDNPITGNASASDVDNDPLTFALVGANGGAAHGTVSLNSDSSFTYTPNPNFNGPDSFSFKANDGSLDSSAATISLTVNPVNDAPAGADKTVATPEDTAYAFTAADFGFTDPTDAGSNSGANVFRAVAITTLPGSGTLRDNGVAIVAGSVVLVSHISAGQFTYAPVANANGNGIASFTFQVQDDGGTANGGVDLDQSPNTITINVTPVNDPPVAQGGSASGNEDTPINGTVVATDIDSASLTYSRVTQAANGNVTVNANGTFSYTPNANFNGTDSFTFKANDGSADSNVATISLTVNPVNDAPVIVSDGGGDAASVSVAENTTAVSTVHTTDPDSTITYSITGGSDAALFQINASSGTLSFVTAPDFENPADSDHNNSYRVQVRASDGSLSDDQVLTVQVTNVPELPQWSKSVDAGMHPGSSGAAESRQAANTPVGPWLPAGTGDFNADGTSDVAWYNSATGSIDIWKLSSGQWAGSANPGSHPAGYQPAGFGDYNGDHTNDILWFNPATRDVDLWKISNGQWAGSVDIGTHPAGFQPTLTGDFSGDGTADIAWYNPTTNGIDIWKIANGQWAGSVDVGAHPAGYVPALAGDFNGDGTSDIAWYNPSTGDVDIWKLSNGQWAGSAGVGPHPAGWQPLGAADFNLDGVSDIAWYNPTNNDIDIWLIKNGQWAGSVDIGTHPAGWTAVGVGDFDHNGVNDVMWFNPTTGHIDNWLLALS